MPDDNINIILEMDDDEEYKEGIHENGIYPYSAEFEIDLKEDVFSIFEYIRKYDRLLNDDRYNIGARRSTGTSANVKTRFEQAIKILGDIA